MSIGGGGGPGGVSGLRTEQDRKIGKEYIEGGLKRQIGILGINKLNCTIQNAFSMHIALL